MFRLLPLQIFLALIGSINSIISGLFATNFVGVNAMTAVGLYSPINMLIYAISTMLVGGATIMCGKYMGKNEDEKVQNVFSVAVVLSTAIALFFIVLFLTFGLFDLTGFIAKDPEVRPLFNSYLAGQAVGLLPLILGNQLAAFLSLENRVSRTTIASVTYIFVNIVLNYIFVGKLQMEAFGLALASSLGLWVYFLIQAQYFFTKGSELKFFKRHLDWSETKDIIIIGIPGAASFGYQTLRGFIVNALLMAYVGAAGVSALASSDGLLRLAWGLPGGMMAVSRMVMSISIGEEDRQTLTDVMRNMFRRFIPLMCVICGIIIACAVPLAKLYYKDTSEPVFMMTVWGFRLLPLSMPLAIICMHFTVYAQSSGKQLLVHILSILDGVVDVALFTAILIRPIGMNSVYIANVLNGVVTTIVVVMYSMIKIKRFPHRMDELMVIPDNFGFSEDERLDISVRKEDEVVKVSRAVNDFCIKRGIDNRRAYMASLFLEEMAGNIVEHGFTKDGKDHSIDIRVVHKGNNVILRIKDDCVPFDPATRKDIIDPGDPAKNIGIRMIYKLNHNIEYKNMLGLNVLMVRL
jgi:Na+-driven multidrug efflux pump/anti-sigma regulatory factor (Ser/Thr protein kinase)